MYGERWEVVSDRPLGEGGQAQTFLVRDKEGDPDARFALKRLKNVNRVERFEQEIQAVMALNHPNVLSLVDYSLRIEGKREKPYMVTEYCAGGSLASGDPSRWESDPAATLELFAQICDGVAAAHLRSGGPIVHRDIKPENVLLRAEDGPPVVGDFGIAFVHDGERERLTAVDEAVGARLFIAPELADGRAEDVRPWSDVYSLGKVLYWMLNGGRVFDREQHRTPRWNLLEKHKRNLYEHINRLLDKMITVEPSERFRTAEEAAGAARYVADLIRRDARALGPDLTQRCDFCKQGDYRAVPMNDGYDYHNFVGGKQISGAMWRVLVCEQCGHVQWFRIENAGGRGAWWGA
ncbi:MAG TPA: serine/threonine-protein kinase [Longimicrobiaceae bacterium]|jgi:serine/threonine protein kinase|nr:serine/threonine-protein kinase [Longimicrobiaceae bacterium]